MNDNIAVNSTVNKPAINPVIILKVIVELMVIMLLVLLLSDFELWFESTVSTTETIDLFGFQIAYVTCVTYWLGSVIGFSAWHIASDIRQLIDPHYHRSEDILDKIVFTIAVVISNLCILLSAVPITKNTWAEAKNDEMFGWVAYISAIAFVLGVVYVLAKAGPRLMNYLQANSESNGVAFLLSNLMCLGAIGFGFLCIAITMVIFVLVVGRIVFWVGMNNNR